ncbi:hypothetical protein N431DRAFT_560521 [Stipitochalara longipes BDJ]|nr:hypothetical protein N431DRAFT_560521 [Stipitochalara longipes BDJ]
MRPQCILTLLLLRPREAVALLHNGNFSTLSDAIPQLAGLPLSPPRHPGLGTMNITNCCLLALNDAFAIRGGYLVIKDPSFLSPGTTPESFLSDMKQGEFPCGSDFNGTEVKASYTWCSIYCPGWQHSQADDAQEWVSPLVSFILPCLVFSTAIPRRRRLQVSDVLFRRNLHDIYMFILAPIRFIVAVVIVTLDYLIWLALCFAFAGPMILSGVFEAFLDSRILDFVAREGKKRLSKVMSTRLLYLILVGNLDFKWKSDTEKGNDGDPWLDLGRLLEKPDQEVELKLPSMVEVQNSYGTTVGVPIAFFCGGFVYNIFDIQTSLGNNDTAHALAFGMWWLIVPHMAIVSSLLLAGNNPFIFQTAVGARTIKHRPVLRIFAHAYESRYKTEWLWFRGRSKFLWLHRTFLLDSTSSTSTPAATSNPAREPQLRKLKSAINFSILDWAQMLLITTILIFMPFILAFLTSFFTPTVGLSCRSMTFLVYFLAQMGQVALWVWVLSCASISDSGILHSPMHRSKPGIPTLLSWIAYWTLAALFIGTSIFAAIGGTIMQLLGVYSNCLCALPVKYWGIRYTDSADAFVMLGSNSAADISAAQKWWMMMGCTATGFLGAATYFGWWYQSRLRRIFREVAEKI